MWLKESNGYFYVIEKFAYGEINERKPLPSFEHRQHRINGIRYVIWSYYFFVNHSDRLLFWCVYIFRDVAIWIQGMHHAAWCNMAYDLICNNAIGILYTMKSMHACGHFY